MSNIEPEKLMGELTVYDRECKTYRSKIPLWVVDATARSAYSHDDLIHVESPNQHPISAITGLEDAISSAGGVSVPDEHFFATTAERDAFFGARP